MGYEVSVYHTMSGNKDFCFSSVSINRKDEALIGKSRALLGSYVESSGNSLPTFRINISILSSRVENITDETDRLSRNVGKELLLLAE